MKKVLLLLMFIPFIGMAQTNNVSSTFRVFPMPGKSLEFKKAIMAHVAKYHTTEKKWRIFEVMSGPDAGAFQFNEGPSSWEAIEKSPSNTDAHTTDWDKTVEVFIEKTSNVGYSVYNEKMSTVKLTDYSNHIIITHMYPSPGMVQTAWSIVEKQKKAYELGNESIAVYNVMASGDPHIAVVRRLKNGMKDLDATPAKSMPDRYREVNGPDSWAGYMEDYSKSIDRRWSEHLMFRADLSSK
jgi:hypothetical protein